MEQEIEEIIKKNLPAHVGETLKKVLEKAKIDSEKVDNLDKALTQRFSEIVALKSQISEYEKYDVRNTKIEEREQKVQEQERSLEITILKVKLEESEKRADQVSEYTKGLVRNIEFRKTIYDNQSEPYKDQYGGTQYQNKTQHSDVQKTAS